MKSIRMFFMVLGLFVIGSCGLKPRGWWTESVIAVMADSTDWNALQGTLRGAFERVVRTPQLEKKFTLKYVTDEEFSRYTEFRYLILAATLESKGRIGKIVGNVVSDSEVRKKVEEGENNVFTLSNQWAKDQQMAVVVANDLPSLRSAVESNSEFLFEIFNSNFNDRLKKEMYETSGKKDLEENLMSMYGWSLYLQRDYFPVQELPNEGFIWFRRMYPERWIFVRWIDGGDQSLLDAQWVVGERNRIGATYYGGDCVANRYLFSHHSTFLGRPAQITTGLWENESKVAGGPFTNYTFYDSLSRRVYMIDLAVFAPEREKLPYMRRQQIIARTFRTVFDRMEEESL
ncbi:MAG: DUF4837 family protein [bacterium]